MPFYDYKCTQCGLILEIQKGMNDNSQLQCKKCGRQLQRIFSIPRTKRPDNEILNSIGSEQSGSCSSCTSGVCSSCSGG